MITKKGFATTNGFVDKFSYFLSPLELDLEEKSKRILSGFMVIFTAPVLLVFSVLHLVRADYPLGIFLLIAGLGLAVSITFLRKFNSVNLFSRINIGFVGLLFLYLLAESGPYGYMAHWLYVYPLVTFFIVVTRCCLSPGLIRSGEYPAKKSILNFNPLSLSTIGMQASSVQPG